MDPLRSVDIASLQLHAAGWVVAESATLGPSGISYQVAAYRDGQTIRTQAASRDHAWQNALLEAEILEMSLPGGATASLDPSLPQPLPPRSASRPGPSARPVPGRSHE
jgi:hypothetical protein